MAIIPAVITDDARTYFPQMQGGLLPYKIVDAFKVGEGGWIYDGSLYSPRTPNSSLRRLDNGIQDIDAVVDATRAVADQRYPAASRATYLKSLIVSDFSYVAPNKLEIRCLLDDTEFLDDGYGNSPEIWEIGVYTDHPAIGGQKLLVAYGTFPKQVKTAVSLLNIVRLVY